MKPNQPATQAVAHLPMVEIRDNKSVTTSLQIAKFFRKDHYNVLRDIRELECSSKFIALNFEAYHYSSKLNESVTRKLPMYYITRDGFTFLVMGFTGKAAAQFKEEYINAFNEMEMKLRELQPKNFVPLKEYNKVLKQVEELKIIAKNTKETSDLAPNQMYCLTDEYCACLIKSFKAWLECENAGAYDPFFRDERLVARFKAARLLYFDHNRAMPTAILFNSNFDL